MQISCTNPTFFTTCLHDAAKEKLTGEVNHREFIRFLQSSEPENGCSTMLPKKSCPFSGAVTFQILIIVPQVHLILKFLSVLTNLLRLRCFGLRPPCKFSRITDIHLALAAAGSAITLPILFFMIVSPISSYADLLPKALNCPDR